MRRAPRSRVARGVPLIGFASRRGVVSALCLAACWLASAFGDPAARAAELHPNVLHWMERSGAMAPGTGVQQRAGSPLLTDAHGCAIVWAVTRAGAFDRDAGPSGFMVDGRWPVRTDRGVSSSVSDVIQMRVSREELRRLIRDDAVSWIGPPPGPTPTVRSQGLAGMNVPALHAIGVSGADVRVGIVDIGFDGYEERIGLELPWNVTFRNFGAGAASGGTSGRHGTACAEVIHDVAPGASLYLAAVSTSFDLANAIEWFAEEGVDVVSHSLAWFVGGGDGSGPVADIVAQAAADGMVWVTSAGNFARAHWLAPFRDADGDDLIELAGGRERFGVQADGNPIDLILLWDRWPLSEEVSFELDLFDGDELRATSEIGPRDPFAFRRVTVPGVLADPQFQVRRTSGEGKGLTLRVFRVDGGYLDESAQVAEGSLAIPADSPHAIAVGAFPWGGDAIEIFSSYGPTVDGRAKPDVLGPDRISTSVDGYDPFVGTSAACPHVAGAAAIYASAQIAGGLFDARMGAADILRLLTAGALPVEGPLGSTGAGRVRLDPRPGTLLRQPIQVSGYRGANGLRFRLLPPPVWPDQDGSRSSGALDARDELHVIDVTGRRLLTLPGRAAGAGREYTLVPGVSLRRGRYWVWHPETRASAGFFWSGR